MENRTETMKTLEKTAAKLERYYQKQRAGKEAGGTPPERGAVKALLDQLYLLTFPGGKERRWMEAGGSYLCALLASFSEALCMQLELALRCGGGVESEQVREKAREAALCFTEAVPETVKLLNGDAEAQFAGDPAAGSIEEVVLSYPGLYAVFVYRYAHILYRLGIPFIPRMMSEYAHSRTGIDINPGAEIGKRFFIDHGTGIVIGETTKIGDRVRLYQGVTLGALSTRKGQQLSGIKRHPTIEDDVIIYANATVLGGRTVIGRNSVIAGNAFIVSSVPANTKAASTLPEIRLTKNRAEDGGN